MKKWLSFAVLLAATMALAQVPDPLKLVDPLIGTGPEGHTFPGATAPFGMVQLSPDTQIRPFKQSYKWAAGYRYEDTTILGFSHTHFSGAGHSDLGDVLLMPLSGEMCRWSRAIRRKPSPDTARASRTTVNTPSLAITACSLRTLQCVRS